MVIPEASLFVEGERLLGRYTVSIGRYSNARWTPTPPPLHVVITNRRLFMRPQVRKNYTPASIPSNYIAKTQEMELGDHNGLMIALTTGHQIYIILSKEDRYRLMDDLSAMKAKPTRIQFDHGIIEQDIQRLIDFINRI
jgi:hypothetical protein